MVSVVLDNLAVGYNFDELIRDYPTLNKRSIQAAITYAAELSKERTVVLA